MNYVMITGSICTVPSVAIVPVTVNDNIFLCKFVVACKEIDDEKTKYDFYMCVAFGQTAKAINDNFYKGTKINIMGKIKNFMFKDDNNTAHFTQIVLAEHVELVDIKSAAKSDDKICKFPIIAELSEMDEQFSRICEEGFLCIDESDYFNIASDNMNICIHN